MDRDAIGAQGPVMENQMEQNINNEMGRYSIWGSILGSPLDENYHLLNFQKTKTPSWNMCVRVYTYKRIASRSFPVNLFQLLLL